MPEYRCEKCGGALEVDVTSTVQLALRGFRGARIFCRICCTDFWLKVAITSVVVVTPDPRGKHPRRERAFVCQYCGLETLTRGANTRRCKACSYARLKQLSLSHGKKRA